MCVVCGSDILLPCTLCTTTLSKDKHTKRKAQAHKKEHKLHSLCLIRSTECRLGGSSQKVADALNDALRSVFCSRWKIRSVYFGMYSSRTPHAVKHSGDGTHKQTTQMSVGWDTEMLRYDCILYCLSLYRAGCAEFCKQFYAWHVVSVRVCPFLRSTPTNNIKD